MDERELMKYIIKNSQKSVGRRAALDDNGIIAYRKSEKNMPYYLQAYRELGSYCYDYSLVDGSYLTKKLAEEVGNLKQRPPRNPSSSSIPITTPGQPTPSRILKSTPRAKSGRSSTS